MVPGLLANTVAESGINTHGVDMLSHPQPDLLAPQDNAQDEAQKHMPSLSDTDGHDDGDPT